MNILPDIQKNNLNKGFKVRFFIVFAVLLSLGIIASTIMLVPSYFASEIELEDVLSQTKFTKTDIDAETKTLLELPKDINIKLQFIKSNTNFVSAFSLITKTINKKPVGISINSLSSINIKDGNKARLRGVIVSGFAKDRKSLIDFSNLLKEEESFDKVDVPVNSLTKETNLPFSITISLSK